MTSVVHTTLLVPGPSQLNVSHHSEAAPTPVVSARPDLDALRTQQSRRSVTPSAPSANAVIDASNHGPQLATPTISPALSAEVSHSTSRARAGVPPVAGPVVQTTEAAPAAVKTGKKVGSKGKARADRDDAAEPEAPRTRTRAMLKNAATK